MSDRASVDGATVFGDKLNDREVMELLDELTYRASRLPFWRAECSHLATLVSRADLQRFKTHLAAEAVAQFGVSRMQWLDAMGLLAEWAMRFARPGRVSPTDAMADEVIDAAFTRVLVERALLWGPEFYDSQVIRSGDRVYVTAPHRKVEWVIDALSTEHAWTDDSRVAPTLPMIERRLDLLRRELLKRSDSERFDFRRAVFNDAELAIGRALLRSESPFRLEVLDPSDEIQGVSVAAAVDVWHGLWSLAFARETVAIALMFPHTDALQLDPEAVVSLAQTAGSGRATAEEYRRAVDLLTLEPSKIHELNNQAKRMDHGIHPILLTHDGALLLVHGLVLENNVERVLLRLAAQENKVFAGRFNDRLDRAPSLAAALRASIKSDRVLVAVGLPMTSGKQRVSDLDVVLVDPVEHLGLVVEVAGAIRPASLYEFRDNARTVFTKIRDQVPSQRQAMLDPNVSVPFPTNWPDRFDVDWVWAVAGSTYLGLNLRGTNLFEVSAETADLFGRFSSLREMIRTHLDPPLLAPCSTTTSHFDTLGMTFTMEGIQVESMSPGPVT